SNGGEGWFGPTRDLGPSGPYGVWPGCGCGGCFLIGGGPFLVFGGFVSRGGKLFAPREAGAHRDFSRGVPLGDVVGGRTPAGALLGLGLTSIGIGVRYAALHHTNDKGQPVPDLTHLYQIDLPFQFLLVFLVCLALVGLGIAFVGLAYHHHRREREHLWEKER